MVCGEIMIVDFPLVVNYVGKRESGVLSRTSYCGVLWVSLMLRLSMEILFDTIFASEFRIEIEGATRFGWEFSSLNYAL